MHVRVEAGRPGAERELAQLTHRREIGQGLIDGTQWDTGYPGAGTGTGADVECLGGRVLVIAVQQTEEQLALRGHLQAPGAERPGELARRSHAAESKRMKCLFASNANQHWLRGVTSGPMTVRPSGRRATDTTRSRPFRRDEMLQRLRAGTFDVLVIGGGITGAGVALDAAVRGLRVALVERDDFASGTSSRSSKLVHGGLRYLQNGDVRLVYEALHERQRLLRNAPHLVDVLPFMIPVLTRDGVISKKVAKTLGSAMWMYDLTGGWRIGKRHRKLSADTAFSHLPTMHRDRVAGGFLYYDASADDARLTLTIARTAAARGAVVANRCRVVDLTEDGRDGRVDGAVVDTGDGEIVVRASVVVNATGVWADEVRSMEHADASPSIRPAKGVHVTVPWERVRNDIAVVIPVPKHKRSLFLVPAGPRGDGTFRHAYVGTTDTDHAGSLDEPQCDAADLEYVLSALNHTIADRPAADTGTGHASTAGTSTDQTVPRPPITPDDVTGVWAGLRPLVAASSSGRTADLSRNHQVTVSDRGVVTVAGGKLTTYRKMAEDTVDEVLRQLDRSPRRLRRLLTRHLGRSTTRRVRLLGATSVRGDVGTREGHLRHRYGTEADELLAMIAVDPTLGDPLVPGQPHMRAEAVFAVQHEMATTLVDVLERRTRVHHFDRAAAEAAAHDVAALLADHLGWDADEIQRQVSAYQALCERERTAAVTVPIGDAHPAGSTSDKVVTT